jgi:beta-fructofuranosidase
MNLLFRVWCHRSSLHNFDAWGARASRPLPSASRRRFYERYFHDITLVFVLSVCSCLISQRAEAESSEQAIARATAAIQAAVPRAQADPAHPIFHVTSPAQWMNDPNGPIYHRGYYHLFYQLHPFSDGDGPKYWGHVRSRDLARWEPLPIALCPSTELGEQGVWSGCCTINGMGQPMIFYTSVTPDKPAQTHAEQWAAIGDDDLITWRKLPENPVLSEALHGGRKIYEWRDPFIFKERHRTFMVAGGNLNETKGGQAVVNIYEAQNPALTQWKYRGVLFQLPDADARTSECPNFFKLGNHWVLLVSPYGKVQYFVGDFDPETCRFESHSRGVLDCGPNFYAPNTMQLPDGRRIVWGWVNGFPGGHGWNGCLTLPRMLTLSRDGQLRQSPARQLKKLRGSPVTWRNVSLDGAAKSFTLPETNTLEISADIYLETAPQVTLAFKGVTNNTPSLVMSFSDSKFKMMDAESPLSVTGKERELRLHIFVDRSVVEVFVNDEICATKIISPWAGDEAMEIRTECRDAKAKLVEVWPMKTIWQ